MSVINDSLRAAIAAAVAGGSTDAGGIRYDVETQLAPLQAARADLSTERSFLASARNALPLFFAQYWQGRVPTAAEADARTDRVAIIVMGDGSKWFVGRCL